LDHYFFFFRDAIDQKGKTYSIDVIFLIVLLTMESDPHWTLGLRVTKPKSPPKAVSMTVFLSGSPNFQLERRHLKRDIKTKISLMETRTLALALTWFLTHLKPFNTTEDFSQKKGRFKGARAFGVLGFFPHYVFPKELRFSFLLWPAYNSLSRST